MFIASQCINDFCSQQSKEANTAASVMEAAVLLCFVDAVVMECAHYGGFPTVGAGADLPYTAELFNLNRCVSQHLLFLAFLYRI